MTSLTSHTPQPIYYWLQADNLISKKEDRELLESDPATICTPS